MFCPKAELQISVGALCFRGFLQAVGHDPSRQFLHGAETKWTQDLHVIHVLGRILHQERDHG